MIAFLIITSLVLLVLSVALFLELKNEGFFVELGIFLFSIISFLTGFGNE